MRQFGPSGLATVLIAGFTSLSLLGPPTNAAPAASLDPGFSGDGSLVIASDIHHEAAGALEVLPDGRALLVTQTYDEPAIQLRRLRKNGAPDTAFGTGGVTSFALPASYEDILVHRHPDTGKVYVSAFIDSGGGTAYLWRFTANGSLDLPFGGGDGTIFYPDQLVSDIQGVSGGKLLLSGDDTVWRINDTGGLDSGFGTAGIVTLDPAPAFRSGSLGVRPDGKILVAGDSFAPGESKLWAFRFRRDGTPDPTFSGDGMTSVDPNTPGVTTSTVWDPSVLLRPDGSTVYVAGLNQSVGNRLLVVGLTKSGAVDGVVGKRVLGGFMAFGPNAALQRDGKIVVGGVIPPSPSDTGAVARLKPNGTFDPTWSGDGLFTATGDDFADTDLSDAGRVLTMRFVDSAPFFSTQLVALRGTPTPTCQGRRATQFGTGKADVIKGTERRDVIVGLGGNDTIKGFGDNDLICGSAGKDKIVGGSGKDTLLGQQGNDTLKGGPEKDKLKGGPGNDTLKGGPGKDTLRGGPGKDKLKQ